MNEKSGYETYRRVAFALEIASFVAIAAALVVGLVHFW